MADTYQEAVLQFDVCGERVELGAQVAPMPTMLADRVFHQSLRVGDLHIMCEQYDRLRIKQVVAVT